MTTKKNTAAKVEAAALPTVAQVQALACKLMDMSLSRAIALAIGGEWKENHQDALNTAEVALDCVRELAGQPPMDADEFGVKLSRIQSVVTLACAAFPDKDTSAWRNLHAAETGFTAVYDALYLAEEAALELAGAFDVDSTELEHQNGGAA